MFSRRSTLAFMAGGVAAGAVPGRLHAASPGLSMTDLRGSIDAGEHGLTPGGREQSRKLGELLARAARESVPLFLPPGNYEVSNIDLPDGARITGVAGASRIVHSGGGYLFRASGASRIELSNLVIDGASKRLGEEVGALIHMRGVKEILLGNCEITGSQKSDIQLEACGGRIENCRISGAAEYGLYAVESSGLSIIGNTVSDCGNGGILVHRRTKGVDGTMVSGNRLSRIGASYGGTGQYGNAVNIYRADNVMVSGNHISDAAFSAIRANAASNVQIANNQCFGSGETAIYSEFGFEGALVTGNLVDGAANGISVVNFNEGGRLAVISGNLIRNISASGPYIHDSVGFGIGISAEADTAVTGNVIENVPKWGMLVGWGPYLRNLAVTGNIVRRAKVGCAVSVAEGAGKALITGNLFDEVLDGAVIGYRWHDAATRELAAGPSSFSHLTIEGNRTG
ncbi:TIGR03808 family TAT-translocated repetitive protein [Rhizobium sp. LCM 4573]|uniref:TIGR03808 family TAT-translocated repetitive protein n=1 Tax=Rhizobium sp. LCM 4573 TaxID=1848291 RepID=UPI0008D9D30B|nr:Tat protein [Rhizobium sp. LCM 4573]